MHSFTTTTRITPENKTNENESSARFYHHLSIYFTFGFQPKKKFYKSIGVTNL